MKVTKDKHPQGMYMSVDHWERGLDPWHVDAFPDEFKDTPTFNRGARKEGWFGVDWVGNPILFVADGEVVEE